MRWLAVLSAAAVAASCGGTASAPASARTSPPAVVVQPAPAAPALPPIVEADAPGSVIAYGVIPSPPRAFADLLAFLRAIAPDSVTGVEAGALGEVVGGLTGVSAAELDVARPMYAVLVDGADVSESVAFVVAIRDRGAFEAAVAGNAGARVHDGYAVIGPPAVVADVANFALTRLRQPVLLSDPTLTVRVQAARARYGSVLAQLGAAAAAVDDGDSLRLATDGALILARDADEISLSVRAGPNGLEARADVHLRPGTAADRFAASVVPASYELAPLVAASRPMMFAAGNLQPTPDGNWFAPLVGLMSVGPGSTARAREIEDELAKLVRGEFAVGLDAGDSMQLAAVGTVADGARARALSRDAFREYERSTAGDTKYRKLRGFRVGAVRVDHYSRSEGRTEPVRASDASWHLTDGAVAVAVDGSLYATTLGARRRVRRAITRILTARRAVASPVRNTISELADESRSNGEAYLFAIDGPRVAAADEGIAKAPGAADAYVVLGLAAGPERLRLRFALGTAAARAMSNSATVAPDYAQVAADLEQLAGRACTCRDPACMRDIGNEMIQIVNGTNKAVEPSGAEHQRIMAALEQLEQCALRFRGATRARPRALQPRTRSAPIRTHLRHCAMRATAGP